MLFYGSHQQTCTVFYFYLICGCWRSFCSSGRQYKILNVPLSSHLAANHFTQQQAEQEERMRMKKLTLDINERQEQEDYQGTKRTPSRLHDQNLPDVHENQTNQSNRWHVWPEATSSTLMFTTSQRLFPEDSRSKLRTFTAVKNWEMDQNILRWHQLKSPLRCFNLGWVYWR